MNILLTGSSGFIGRHVVTEISKQDYNIGLLLHSDSNSNIDLKIIDFDLSNFELSKKSIIDFMPDVVIHLAWMGIPDYSQEISISNLNCSINFLNFIIDNTNCSKIIVSGSCWEYGKQEGICIEDEPIRINSSFSWAKNSLYNFLLYKCNNKNIIINWFRLFYVYGPGQRSISLIQNLIESINNKKVPNIMYPENRNDFVYVGDVAKAISKAIINDVKTGIYNLGSGNSTSVYDICKIVEKQILQRNEISKKVLENGESLTKVNFYANMEKTNTFLKYLCDTTIEDGIVSQINHNMNQV